MDHGMDDLSSIAQNVKKESTREQFSYRRDHRRVVRCMLNPALSRVSARHQGVQPGAKIAEEFALAHIVLHHPISAVGPRFGRFVSFLRILATKQNLENA